MAKVVVQKSSGNRVLGMHIASPNAGEIIQGRGDNHPSLFVPPHVTSPRPFLSTSISNLSYPLTPFFNAGEIIQGEG